MKMFRSILCEIDLSGEVPDTDTTMRKWKATKHLSSKKRYSKEASSKLDALKKEMRISPAGGNKKHFENPLYMVGTINHWAGHPDSFTQWTPYMAKMYVQLKEILAANGVPTFQKMYYAEKPWHSGRRKGSGLNAIARNFVLIADDGRFVWRNYDSGSDYGAGQNSVYINGTKIATSTLMTGTVGGVRKLMAPIARGDLTPLTNPRQALFKKKK